MALNPQNLQVGQEQYEYFYSRIRRGRNKYCQYDYRDKDGELFSCVRPTLEEAREAFQWGNYYQLKLFIMTAALTL